MPTTRRPALPRSVPSWRPDGSRRLSCSPRAAPQAEVARTLGVSRQSAHLWHARFAQGGVDALGGRGPTGPDPRLSAAQLAKVDEKALPAGAMANGFDTDLWTLERVAVVITQLTRVRYHPGHVWVILRQRLGWTLQRPERRASERDKEAIARWVAEDWPWDLPQPRRRRAAIVSWDEAGASLLAVVRRTWAPVGHTPAVRHRFKWQRPPWRPRCAVDRTAAAPSWPSTTRPPPTTPTR
jgi:transposase